METFIPSAILLLAEAPTNTIFYNILVAVISLLTILLAVLKGYSFIRKEIKEQEELLLEQINLRFVSIKEELERHIQESDNRMKAVENSIKELEHDNKEIVSNYKKEFTSVRKDISDFRLELTNLIAKLTTNIAVISTKQDLLLTKNEEI